MQSDFPHTPDAVEPKWLTATLQNHGTLTPDQQVVAVQQTPIGDIVGWPTVTCGYFRNSHM